MNVLFLDVDGVLNSTESVLKSNKTSPTREEKAFLLKLCITHYRGYPLSTLTTDLLGLRSECIENLNTILEASDASVVLSSSWRFSHNLKGLQKLLEFRGFRGQLVGITPINLMGATRGAEIQAWMSLNPEVERIVILDDNTDMGHLKRFLVKVDRKTGLTKMDATKAISIIVPDSFGI